MTELADSLLKRLERTSEYMLYACAGLDDALLRLQFEPAFSPIGWHLGHVAWQEELWLLREFARVQPICREFDAVFDSFRPHKAERGRLLPPRSVLVEYRAEVRERVRRQLPRLLEQGSGLMQGAGLLRFVANHESQHVETVLALRLAGNLPLSEARVEGEQEALGLAPECLDFVEVTGGNLSMGTSSDPERWDNESPCHEVDVPGFMAQRAPVSNHAWQGFVESGGYLEPRWWSPAGWQFVQQRQLQAPLYWCKDATGRWQERTLAGSEALCPARPVCHISWHEAQAFARFSGARLLKETEWEWLAHSSGADSLPDAADSAPLNLALRSLARAPGGGPVRHGISGLMGGVWEWTLDTFAAYPGFAAQAYAGYSKPWFDGKHRVLRGGSYVSEPEIARVTFRNWYLPELRLPFLGLRLAKDVAC